VGIIGYLARVQLEAPDLQLVDAPAHFIKVRIARIIRLMCDGIIIPGHSGALPERRDSGNSGGTGNAHIYEGTPKCGHQEHSRG